MKFYIEEGCETLLEWCEANEEASLYEEFEGYHIRYFLVPTPRPCPHREDPLPDTMVRFFIGLEGDWWSPPIWVFSIGEARNTVRQFWERHGCWKKNEGGWER